MDERLPHHAEVISLETFDKKKKDKLKPILFNFLLSRSVTYETIASNKFPLKKVPSKKVSISRLSPMVNFVFEGLLECFY